MPQNSWTKFQKANAGKGLTCTQMSKMYKKGQKKGGLNAIERLPTLKEAFDFISNPKNREVMEFFDHSLDNIVCGPGRKRGTEAEIAKYNKRGPGFLGIPGIGFRDKCVPG